MNVPVEPFNRTCATNQSYGGVFRLLPWLAVGGGYFESSLFADSVCFELTGKPRLPRNGEGHELSLRFNFLNDRISTTLTRFQTTAEKSPRPQRRSANRAQRPPSRRPAPPRHRYALGKARAALSSGGQVVLPARKTGNYVLVNPFVSYRRKLLGRNWTAQLNVNNVFNLHSDQGNSYTWPRYTEPRQYITTVTMDW